MLDNQTAFNKVWQHFVVEKNPPGYRNTSCVYFDPETGVRCAIGCLLPPSLNRGGLKGTVCCLIRNNKAVGKALKDCDERFLDDLQSVHDRSTIDKLFHKRVRTDLRRLAKTWILEVPRA